jgi:hypothetical protein
VPRGHGGHWSDAPGRRSAPDDPESEDLLALAAIAARSRGTPRTGSLTRQVQSYAITAGPVTAGPVRAGAVTVGGPNAA